MDQCLSLLPAELNQDIITKWSAHLARVDVCQELVHFNERFLLLRVFDLVGDAKVDSESKIPERGNV